MNFAAGKEEFILREEIREAYYKSRRNYMLKKKGLPVPMGKVVPHQAPASQEQVLATSEDDIPF